MLTFSFLYVNQNYDKFISIYLPLTVSFKCGKTLKFFVVNMFHNKPHTFLYKGRPKTLPMLQIIFYFIGLINIKYYVFLK